MSIQHPRAAFAQPCTYRPTVGELAPNEQGIAECPVCSAWLRVTKRGTLRPHLDYRRLSTPVPTEMRM